MKLITANGIIESIEKLWGCNICNDNCVDEQGYCNCEIHQLKERVAEAIAITPIAYDVDKVCEELWNESRQNVGMDTRLSTIVAIDIVKRGGVNERKI